MFCKYCGAQQPDGVAVCCRCGRPLDEPAAPTPPPYTPPAYTAPPTYTAPPAYTPPRANNDSGSWGWWFLGFFVPLAGLILFAIWQTEKPLSAKRAGIGALVGFIVSVVLEILLGILITFLPILIATEMTQDLTGGFMDYIRAFLSCFR